jgi:hypothetical protein
VYPAGTAYRLHIAGPAAMTGIAGQEYEYTRPECPGDTVDLVCGYMWSVRRGRKRCVFRGCFGLVGILQQRVLLLECTRCDRLVAGARVVGFESGSVLLGSGDQGCGIGVETETVTEIGGSGGRRGDVCNVALGIG